MLWGLHSRDADIFQIPLLKSETAIIDRPCLLLANAFGLVKRGKTIYAASLITDEPFFCIAAVWRKLRASRSTRSGSPSSSQSCARGCRRYADTVGSASIQNRHARSAARR